MAPLQSLLPGARELPRQLLRQEGPAGGPARAGRRQGKAGDARQRAGARPTELDGWHDVDEINHIDLKSGVVVDLCDGAAHRANRARRAASPAWVAPARAPGRAGCSKVLEPVSVDLHAAVPGERP